jgi:methylphosphotriester-DNA--protein-cysteine methyltransferase
MAEKKRPAFQAHHRIKQLERQLDDAIKVRNILIVAGKVSSSDFEAAEKLVRDLAPGKGAGEL